MYGTSRFGEKLKKRSSGTETGKIEEKRLETDKFLKDSRNSWSIQENLQFKDQNCKQKDDVWYSKNGEDSRDSRMT